MKRLLLIAMLLCGTDTLVGAAQTGVSGPQVKPEDSPLVKAAKASGGPKKKSTKKVITNKDVKTSKGKITTLPPKTAAAVNVEPAKGLLEKQSDQRKADAVSAVRISAAEKKVSDLEKELRRLEDAYYDESVPNYRDSAIEKRFNQTKQQLEDARKELTDAREAQTKPRGKPQS